jgi:hypothetical protein
VILVVRLLEQILNFIVGLEHNETDVEEIKRDPNKVLLANADEDPEFVVKARNAFSALENGDEDNVDICRVFTIKELQKELFETEG